MNVTLKYLKNLLIALDQLANTILGGSPDVCISTRAYEHYPRVAKVIDFIFMNPKHCEESAENEDDEGIIK
jgi:hypothetical protein